MVAAAQALHEEGLLEHIIGHDVPVLIDAELGNDRSMRELNRLANPKAFHARTDRWDCARRELRTTADAIVSSFDEGDNVEPATFTWRSSS